MCAMQSLFQKHIFINENNKVEMTSSQRCAKQIYELANNIVKNSSSENAFYKIEIQGTSKNPISEKQPTYSIFENEKDEKTFIVEKSFDRKYGARPLRRLIEQEIEDRLAEKFLEGEIPASSTIIISAKENKLNFKITK